MPVPRAHLRDIKRVDSADIRGDFIRLDRNERVSPLPEPLFREILGALSPDVFSSYPDPLPLNRRLAASVGLPEGWAVATNGSDASIRRVFHAFVAPGDRVVFTDPTYAMYDVYTRIFEGAPVRLAYASDRSLGVAPYLEAIAEGARLVCVVNPDQPTGAVLTTEEIGRIAAAARAVDAVCLVDETYYPCHPETAVGLVERYDNLVVTRSMSKVAGLGGLRVGFHCAQPAMIEALGKVRGLHEVNAVAVAVGCYMLDRPDIVEGFRQELEAGRAVLRDFARRHNFGFPRCPTNFQLIELPDALDPRALVDALKARGFLVKGGYTAASVARCLRVTLDGPRLMRRFAEAFESVLSGAAA